MLRIICFFLLIFLFFPGWGLRAQTNVSGNQSGVWTVAGACFLPVSYLAELNDNAPGAGAEVNTRPANYTLFSGSGTVEKCIGYSNFIVCTVDNSLT